MDAALKLDIAVGLLTRRSHHLVKDPHTGKSHVVLAEPLLVQLRMASANSTAAPVEGAGSSAPTLPLSASAHDLMVQIEGEAEYHYFVHGGVRRDLQLADHIRALVVAAQLNQETLGVVEKLVCGWVAAIQGFFNPQRRRPLRGAVCPNKKCGAARVLDREEEGEHFYKPALVQVCDDEGLFDRLECGVCGSSWSGLELELMGALAK